ncbi:MAG: NAD kinase, partial [Bacteroidaceae bacterium]
MKFAIIGNTFQPKKCVQAAQLFNILRNKGAEIAVCKDFYEFLVRDLKMNIHADELFENRDFDADMVLSMGG